MLPQVCQHYDKFGTNFFEWCFSCKQRVLPEQAIMPIDSRSLSPLCTKRAVDIHQRFMRVTNNVPSIQTVQGFK